MLTGFLFVSTIQYRGDNRLRVQSVYCTGWISNKLICVT